MKPWNSMFNWKIGQFQPWIDQLTPPTQDEWTGYIFTKELEM